VLSLAELHLFETGVADKAILVRLGVYQAACFLGTLPIRFCIANPASHSISLREEGCQNDQEAVVPALVGNRGRSILPT
jgi:hypothetical protein